MLFFVHDPNFVHVHVFIHTSPYKVADLITRLSEKSIHLLDPVDKRRRIPKSYLHADVHGARIWLRRRVML